MKQYSSQESKQAFTARTKHLSPCLFPEERESSGKGTKYSLVQGQTQGGSTLKPSSDPYITPDWAIFCAFPWVVRDFTLASLTHLALYENSEARWSKGWPWKWQTHQWQMPISLDFGEQIALYFQDLVTFPFLTKETIHLAGIMSCNLKQKYKKLTTGFSSIRLNLSFCTGKILLEIKILKNILIWKQRVRGRAFPFISWFTQMFTKPSG